ncbi:MAG TPA: hypothetical protein VH436_32870, partial [Vicinamibacterales bacterium]
RVARDPFTENVQFSLTLFERALASREFLQPPPDRRLQAFHLAAEILAMEVLPKALDRVSPAACVTTHDRADLFALAQAR